MVMGRKDGAMAEIVFEIDEETGELTTTIRGLPGKACEPVADLLKQLLGTPTVERNTEEYTRARVQARPQLRAGEGR